MAAGCKEILQICTADHTKGVAGLDGFTAIRTFHSDHLTLLFCLYPYCSTARQKSQLIDVKTVIKRKNCLSNLFDIHKDAKAALHFAVSYGIMKTAGKDTEPQNHNRKELRLLRKKLRLLRKEDG